MRFGRLIPLLTILALSNPALATESIVTAISLQPADGEMDRAWPYRPAWLEIKSSAAYRAVTLRWTQGGPTQLYPATADAEGKARLLVHLPAIALVQEYEVHLFVDAETALADGQHAGEPGASATAQIAWPAEWLTTSAFLDPQAYGSHSETLPAWPAMIRRGAALLAVLLPLTAGAAMLIPAGRWRTLGLGGILLAATLAGSLLCRNTPVLVIREDGKNLVVLSRRTTAVVLESVAKPSKSLYPVYAARWQILEDDLLLRGTQPYRYTQRPAMARLFRQSPFSPSLSSSPQ